MNKLFDNRKKCYSNNQFKNIKVEEMEGKKPHACS